jgi:hypothetical protein
VGILRGDPPSRAMPPPKPTPQAEFCAAYSLGWGVVTTRSHIHTHTHPHVHGPMVIQPPTALEKTSLVLSTHSLYHESPEHSTQLQTHGGFFFSSSLSLKPLHTTCIVCLNCPGEGVCTEIAYPTAGGPRGGGGHWAIRGRLLQQQAPHPAD